MPPALALHLTEDDLQELARDAVVLRWQGRPTAGQVTGVGSDDPVITVRLSALQGGEPTGAELTCVLFDVGQARLAFDTLRTLGLPTDAEALRITASRMHTASFDAGDFVGSELLVERRESLILPLR